VTGALLNGAAPGFGLGTLAWILTLVRAGTLAALFVVLGTPLLGALVPLPPAAVRLLRLGLIGAALGLVAWLLLQTAALTDANDARDMLAGVPEVLTGTRFGTLIVWRLGLLAAIALVPVRRWRGAWPAALALAVPAVALEAWDLHAASMAPGLSLLLASEVLHVLAAAAWLGALPALWLAVRGASAEVAVRAGRRFFPIGTFGVLGLAGSAAWQGWVLLGGLPGVVGTAYGWLALGKTLLFVALIGLAARNRLRLVPALARAPGPATRRALGRSIAGEMAVGLLTVWFAAVLGALPPGMHLQPVWPFTWRAVVATASPAAVAAAGGFALPRLGLLFLPATPTAYYRSPTRFAADSIADGAALYPAHCARCHRADGRGDGPDAALLPVPPADLTGAHLWMHDDGEMFWYLTAGIPAPDGAPAMPGFAAVLGEDDRWALIDYLRARNAGVGYAAQGRWTPPVLAPSFLADCGGAQAVPVGEPGPRVWRVVFLGAGQSAPPPAGGAMATVAIAPAHAALAPAGGVCVAGDPAIRDAYAVVGGVSVAQLDGMQALIDRNGWLRALQPAGPVAAEQRRALAAAPLPRGSVFVMPHHH
jgi:putative copper export protein